MFFNSVSANISLHLFAAIFYGVAIVAIGAYSLILALNMFMLKRASAPNFHYPSLENINFKLNKISKFALFMSLVILVTGIHENINTNWDYVNITMTVATLFVSLIFAVLSFLTQFVKINNISYILFFIIATLISAVVMLVCSFTGY